EATMAQLTEVLFSSSSLIRISGSAHGAAAPAKGFTAKARASGGKRDRQATFPGHSIGIPGRTSLMPRTHRTIGEADGTGGRVSNALWRFTCGWIRCEEFPRLWC